MKNFFLILIALSVFVGNSFANKNTIRIAISNNNIPYSYVDKYNQPKGMLVDYWDLWAKKTNRNIKFVSHPTLDSYNSKLSNTIDIYIGLYMRDELQKKIKYINPIFNTTSSIYVKKNGYINHIKDLENKTIGLIINSHLKSDIEQTFSSSLFKYFSSYDEMIDALVTDDIDALAGNTDVILYKLIKIYKHNEFSTIDDFIINKMLFSGIENYSTNFKLEELIIKGSGLITEQELDDIYNKWVLKDRYVLKNKNIHLFTKEEKNYIKQSPKILIGAGYYAPFYFINEKNELSGLVGEYFKLISKVSGLKFKVVQDIWKNNLEKFKNKKVDILPGIFHTKERAKFGLYSKGYIDIRTSLIVNDTNKDILSFENLEGKKLAVMEKDARIPRIKKLFNNITIVETKDVLDSLYKLKNNEVDAIAELDLVVHYTINEKAITGTKTILQNVIKPLSIHVLSKNDDLLLQSIIQKSLNNISIKEKNKILRKWIFLDTRKQVNVAFNKPREPYIFDKSYIKGIEYDLIKKTLSKSNIYINEITHLSYEKLEMALKDDYTLDMAVSIKEKDDGFYYSSDFIGFENVAVSRVKDDLIIDKIEDLPGKKIGAFYKSHKYLGKKYNELFNPSKKSDSFKEYPRTEKLLMDFFNKKTDVIILDKDIFKWYLKKLKKESVDLYRFHYIFWKENSYKIAFRDDYLRNIFNDNYSTMKKSGEVDNIILNYTQRDIEAKVKINSLIANILAKYILSNDINTINTITEHFSMVDYINKIEVYDENDKFLSFGSSSSNNDYSLQDSHYNISNIPTKVGYIKVFFDERKLIKASRNLTPVPSLEVFRKLDSFSHIKKIYKNFNYLSDKPMFSRTEKNYIKENKIITFSEYSWDPLFILKEDNSIGLIVDYMKIVEDKTGLIFKYKETKSWLDSIDKFNKKEIDILPSMNKYEKDSKNGLLSKSYASFNFAIVTNEKGSFTDGLAALKGKKLALPVGFAAYNYIKRNYSDMEIIETQDNLKAMDLVSKGKADAFVGHTAVAVHNIKHYFQDLKIVGISKYEFEHQFLVQKSNKTLLSIIDKAILTITKKQRIDIKEKWMKTEINTAVNYEVIYKIIGIFSIILIIILLFTKKLSSAKKSIETINNKLNKNITKLEVTQEKLENKNDELATSINTLKLAQEKLIESEKMASLGGLVAGVAHEINTPIGIGLTGITHFLDILRDIQNKYDNQNMSKEEFEEYLKISNTLAEQININLERTAQLVRSFKQVAADQTSEEKRNFGLKAYVNDILLSIDSVLTKTRLNVSVICEEEIVINSYPGAFSQIISNLVVNSIRHAYEDNEEGDIVISIYKENDTIIVKYKDDGKGISEENIRYIFEPFFTTNRNLGGIGLGLNIIYNIISTTLKGTITCTSIENEGAEFIITFSY